MRRRAQAAASALAGHFAARQRLEVCVFCGHDFVNPVDWETEGDDHWRILLRCGHCDVSREVTVTHEETQRFDRELNRRAAPIARSAERLERDGMRRDAETLIAALRLDLIDAADFAR